MVHLQELYGEINTVDESVCIFYNRHLEVLFTRPQSMDNMRKSKGIFPVITSDISRKFLAREVYYAEIVRFFFYLIILPRPI